MLDEAALKYYFKENHTVIIRIKDTYTQQWTKCFTKNQKSQSITKK